ncbi:MAG: EAL domain-containing protein [Ilumatobacteraceae bacterium]
MTRSRIAPVVYGLLGIGAVLAYVLTASTAGMERIAVGAIFGAATAVFVAMAVHRPVRPVPWFLYGVGIAMLGVAALVRSAEWFGSVGAGFPAGAEMIAILAYPSLFVATISITSGRRHAPDLLAGSEPIIYATAATALVWLGLTGPYFDQDRIPLASEAWIWIFPLLDGTLALLALRRIDRSVAARRVFETMTLGFLLLGAAHGATAWAASVGSLELGSPLAATLMLGPITLGLVATLPALTAVTAAAGEPVRVHWLQIVGLVLAALVPLGGLLLMRFGGFQSSSSFVVVALATVTVIVLSLGRMWRLVDQVRSLTEQRGHARLAAMVEHSSDVVMLADDRGRVSYASPGLRATLGYDPESWTGRHLVDVVVEDERETAERSVERLIESGQGSTVEFETSLLHADGQQRKANVVIANLVGGAAVDGIVATFRDVTEQRNLERQLSHRAFHDELTGLANRALFLDRMDHALRVTRPVSDPVVVLFVDLDDFKSVNDALGHGVGDQLLKTVANRIREAAGSGDTSARLGGDEFAILLEDRGGIDRAIDVAESLLESLRDPVTIAGYDVAVLASVGVAVASSGMNTTSLLRDADIAMYEAKRAGKGQIRIFDPAMRLVATKHLEYRGELGAALHNDELRLVYMPFVDLRTGQVTGAEALVRWHHAEHGDIPASEFIPIAERSGLIVPMGYWILDQALQQAASWRPGLFISINVSAVQIRQVDFVERVIAAVDHHHVDPSTIVFEITETVLVDEGDRATETMRHLRDEGFRFAVDDFGAGFCSLSHLQRHPVDLLKIDRAAIEDFGNDPRGNTLARTILQMAESLELLTVAEGIETTSQLRELRRFGCDVGQGYLLSRPLEAEDLAVRFRQSEPVGAY